MAILGRRVGISAFPKSQDLVKKKNMQNNGDLGAHVSVRPLRYSNWMIQPRAKFAASVLESFGLRRAIAVQ